MFEIIEYLKAKKEERKGLVHFYADEILKLKGEDFTTAIDLLAEEQGINTTNAYTRLIADATIGKYMYVPQV